ncbi:MAG: dockerin type I repeat-containing protein [Phycisphaerales bacterium]|nr:dockerin type I repeat-containing protein [Phycisphaerales bacterium]
MTRSARFIALGAVLLGLLPLAAQAQFLSEKVGFNGPPIDNAATSQEMFRIPEFGFPTSGYIIANDPNVPFGNNRAFRASQLFTEGVAAERIFFKWTDPNDANSWVRLSTFSGPIRPNPSLHLDGKVAFKLINRSEIIRGRVGLALGIRETGVNVPQMEDGGASGPIEWVGVRTTPNAIIAGANGIVDTTAAGDDIQVYPVGFNINDPNNPLPSGTAVILPGPNGVINTTPAGDDQLRFGYSLDPNGNRFPLPQITLNPSAAAYTIEFDLVTGNVTLNGVNQGGGIAGFTGDGVLGFDPNSGTPQRGTLEHLAITKVFDPSIQAASIELALDELQFNAPQADPTRPPLVKAPIIAGDTSYTVTNLMYNCNGVRLFRNGQQIAETLTGFPATEMVFTNLAAAQPGQLYTATQRNSQTGLWSDPSPAVPVLDSPPPYSFAILVDEGGGGSCSTATGWEFVGATSASGFIPQGTLISPDSSRWQAIDIPFDDPAVVKASPYGNGVLAYPSVSGFYTIDTVWFTVAPNTPIAQAGPWEIFIDAVTLLDATDTEYDSVLSAEDGINRFAATRGQSTELPSSAGLSSLASFDGASSHRLVWTYDFDPNVPTIPNTQSLGQLQRTINGCGTSDLIDDDVATLRFYLLCREPRVEPNIPLANIQTPVVGNQTTIRVDNDPAATQLIVFVNGFQVGTVTPVGTPTDVNVALQTGDSVSVKQVTPDGTSDFGYPRGAWLPVRPTIQKPVFPGATSVTITGLLTNQFAKASLAKLYDGNGTLLGQADPNGAAQVTITGLAAIPGGTALRATQVVNGAESLYSAVVLVGAPPSSTIKVNPPIQAGDVFVRVTGVENGVTSVTVYDNNVPIGTTTNIPGSTVDVPVSPLVHLGSLTATQSNPFGTGPRSVAKEVGKGNGDVFVCIAIRETETNAPLGAPGGTSGAIEWLGITDPSTSAPRGKPISPSANWQTMTFTPGVDGVKGFTGNGVLDPGADGKGVLEHIAVTVQSASNDRSVGTYLMYVDNVVNVGAGPGGTDFLITNFESFNVGALPFLRTPRFSGSTAGLLEDPVEFPTIPDISRVSDAQGNPGKSLELSWYFKASSAATWVRLTTFGSEADPNVQAALLRNPTIDMTKPLRFDLLLLPVLPPPAPVLSDALEALDTTVRVSGVLANATSVRVYADGFEIGQINPGGAAVVDVPVAPLQALDSITAKQFTSTTGSGPSNAIEVGRKNGAVLLTLGVRETGDAGPLGSLGGTTGPIEWIGAATTSGGAPQGKPISPSNNWQTVTFDPAADPILSFLNGNGVIDGTRGTLEHLAIASNSGSPLRSSGTYRVFIDNVVNVGAGPGGTDFVLSDFESFDDNTEVLFQEPTFSGTTNANLLAAPSDSGVSSAYGNPGKSIELVWFFRDSGSGRWVRLTTFAAGQMQLGNPVIDLTRPIRMDVLLLVECMDKGDFDNDGDVDINDFDAFVACLAGPEIPTAPGCNCGDFDNDGRIDLFDFAEFQLVFQP